MNELIVISHKTNQPIKNITNWSNPYYLPSNNTKSSHYIEANYKHYFNISIIICQVFRFILLNFNQPPQNELRQGLGLQGPTWKVYKWDSERK